ncbi:helix-turn-helix domain-containing protein [Bacillus sp. FJAT-26390]|uniref:helix-turn-helix domain-containing protein n=1 Tax=Bacillus sp. FJAT-26390 TaxID=1743142 RepID=UPI0008080225|nr:helix-turn-helix domain-containing protein [Bacillus sp. FJAT-26390]OBZ13701.1 hypothetical protein A7975_12875 [Bacillus sp. FJAT-26390]
MKFNSLSIIISALILGVSIIAGCTIIANHEGQITEQAPGEILNIEQAAAYLDLSEKQVNLIINAEQSKLQNSGSFSGKMFPYFKVGSDIFISKSGLADWINEAASARREYVFGDVMQ